MLLSVPSHSHCFILVSTPLLLVIEHLNVNMITQKIDKCPELVCLRKISVSINNNRFSDVADADVIQSRY